MPVRKLLRLLLSIPKTVCFNFRAFPLQTAVKLPVLVGYRTRIENLRGKIELKFPPKPFAVRLNWAGTESRNEGRPGFLSIGKAGSVTFYGKATLSSGMSLICDQGALSFGKDFFCNCNCCISCNEKIEIGDGGMWGWNVELLDSDNHLMIRGGIPAPTQAPIAIGDHVWLAAYTHVLKGAQIPDGCIVGYRSLVNKPFAEQNALIAGAPAKIVGRQADWSKTVSHE